MTDMVKNPEVREKLETSLKLIELYTTEITDLFKKISANTAYGNYEVFLGAQDTMIEKMNYRFIEYRRYHELQKEDAIENPIMQVAEHTS